MPPEIPNGIDDMRTQGFDPDLDGIKHRSKQGIPVFGSPEVGLGQGNTSDPTDNAFVRNRNFYIAQRRNLRDRNR